jgi:hypothetical protein
LGDLTAKPTLVDDHDILSGLGCHRRRALCELVTCLIAYDFGPDGRVTPGSCYRGYEGFSWGQKKAPSPLATGVLCGALRRLDELAREIRAVDVLELGRTR